MLELAVANPRSIDDVCPTGDAIESGWRAFGAPVGLVGPNFRSDVFPHHRRGQQMAFGLTRGHTIGPETGRKKQMGGTQKAPRKHPLVDLAAQG